MTQSLTLRSVLFVADLPTELDSTCSQQSGLANRIAGVCATRVLRPSSVLLGLACPVMKLHKLEAVQQLVQCASRLHLTGPLATLQSPQPRPHSEPKMVTTTHSA